MAIGSTLPARMVRLAGVALLASALMFGCGDSDDDDESDTTAPEASTSEPLEDVLDVSTTLAGDS